MTEQKKRSRMTLIVAASADGLVAFGPQLAGLPNALHAQAAEAGVQISPGLVLPPMDPMRGKQLFASKGCVVCHAVNGVGGTDAPAIDAASMEPEMSPFDFFVKMWNHSQGMIAMQEDEIGAQITFENGQELADIVAFLHDADVQKTFTAADVPADMRAKIDTGMDMMGGDKNMMNDGMDMKAGK